MFYIENFALRLLFCIGTCIAAVLLVLFIISIVTSQPLVIDPLRHILLPGAFGLLAAFMWKPSEK